MGYDFNPWHVLISEKFDDMVLLDLHFFTLFAGWRAIGFTRQSFSDFQLTDMVIISIPLV
jgi:hypothetical protein